MKKKILSALFLLCLYAVLLAACSEDLPTLPAEDGYAVSGCITADGEPLEGVSIFVDGQEAGKTNSFGIYSLTGLEYGTIITFVADGYTFSPESYTVRENAYDLNVLAFNETPDDEDDDNEDPSDPEEPVDPEEPTEPEEPEQLGAPQEFFAAYTGDGNIVLNFSTDIATQTFSFTLSSEDTSLTAECAAKNGEADFGEFSVPIHVDSESEDGLSVLMNITEAVSYFNGKFTVAVTASAENMTDGVSAPFVCSFAAGEPRVYGLTLQDGILTWNTEYLPDGCTFAVIVNGLKLYETTAAEVNVAELPFTLPDGATLRIAAEKDGTAVAVSEEIIFGQTAYFTRKNN